MGLRLRPVLPGAGSDPELDLIPNTQFVLAPLAMASQSSREV